MKPTALIKASSRLLGREDVIKYVKILSDTYALRFLSGGGDQISTEFAKRCWENKFEPLGRECKTFEQRLIAENVLKVNSAEFEDQLQRAGVFGQMVLPVMDNEVGQVTCHVNGDLYPIICYNGYDRFFVLTLDEDVKRKTLYYMWMWQINRLHLANRTMAEELILRMDDRPAKIEVVGFPRLGSF